jgi:hypothetical protein
VNTKKVAVVAEIWYAKGINMVLEIASMLSPEYEVNVLGRWAVEPWYRDWIEYFVAEHKLNITFEEYADDMNEWLEDKSHAMTCSIKEAFSYAIGEGMAKGIKPVIFDFKGSRDIWPKEHIFSNTIQALMRISKIDQSYEPEKYRNYIAENYSLTSMMEKIDKVCGT